MDLDGQRDQQYACPEVQRNIRAGQRAQRPALKFSATPPLKCSATLGPVSERFSATLGPVCPQAALKSAYAAPKVQCNPVDRPALIGLVGKCSEHQGRSALPLKFSATLGW